MNRFDLFNVIKNYETWHKDLIVDKGKSDEELSKKYDIDEMSQLRLYEAMLLMIYNYECIRCNHFKMAGVTKCECLVKGDKCSFSPMNKNNIPRHNCFYCAGYSEGLGMCDVKIVPCKNHELWTPSKRYLERLQKEEKGNNMSTEHKYRKNRNNNKQMLSSEVVARLAEMICVDADPHSDEMALSLFMDYILRLPEEFTMDDVKKALTLKLQEGMPLHDAPPEPGDVVLELENSRSGRSYRTLIWSVGMTTHDPLGYTTYRVLMRYSDVLKCLNMPLVSTRL